MLGDIIYRCHRKVVSFLNVYWATTGSHTPEFFAFVFWQGFADGFVVDCKDHLVASVVHVASHVDQSGIVQDWKLNRGEINE